MRQHPDRSSRSAASQDATIRCQPLNGLPRRDRKRSGPDLLTSVPTVAERLVPESGGARAVGQAEELAQSIQQFDGKAMG
jgi:hypothetical protein